MQGRSWMAALTLVAAAAGAFGLKARAEGPTPIKQMVKLTLRIDGFAPPKGCELVIKPGSPGCRFKEIVRPIKEYGDIRDIPPIEVETLGADRDCSFSITLKEPGQADKTIRRIVQIAAPAAVPAGKVAEPQAVQFYFTSRSLTGGAVADKPTPGTTKK